MLYLLVERHGSLREFAARVGQSHTVFSQIRAGLRPAPLEHVPQWADALGLAEGTPERERFIDLAALTHLPPESRARFEKLLVRHDELLAKFQAMRRLYDELQAKSPRHPRPPPRQPPPPERSE